MLGSIIVLPLVRCRYELISEVALDREATYLMAAAPHGVFPMGQWLSIPHAAEAGSAQPSELALLRCFPRHCAGAVANALFRLPFARCVATSNPPGDREVPRSTH